MREAQRGTVSSNSRFQTALFQQYSVNLFFAEHRGHPWPIAVSSVVVKTAKPTVSVSISSIGSISMSIIDDIITISIITDSIDSIMVSVIIMCAAVLASAAPRPPRHSDRGQFPKLNLDKRIQTLELWDLVEGMLKYLFLSVWQLICLQLETCLSH